jgi:hypothetical protein
MASHSTTGLRGGRRLASCTRQLGNGRGCGAVTGVVQRLQNAKLATNKAELSPADPAPNFFATGWRNLGPCDCGVWEVAR